MGQRVDEPGGEIDGHIGKQRGKNAVQGKADQMATAELGQQPNGAPGNLHMLLQGHAD